MQSFGFFAHNGLVSFNGTGRFTIFNFSFAGETSTTSFSPFSFSFSSVFASSWISSTTVSVSNLSAASMVSYSVSAFALDKKIGVGMKEQYFSMTSLARYSFANSRQSSFRYKVISVPTPSFVPSVISNSVPPSHAQWTGVASFL